MGKSRPGPRPVCTGKWRAPRGQAARPDRPQYAKLPDRPNANPFVRPNASSGPSPFVRANPGQFVVASWQYVWSKRTRPSLACPHACPPHMLYLPNNTTWCITPQMVALAGNIPRRLAPNPAHAMLTCLVTCGVSCVVALVHSRLPRGPRLRTSLWAIQASELGTCVSPLPGWSCEVTTDGLGAVSHKRAQGPCTRP